MMKDLRHRSCLGFATDLAAAKKINASVMCDLEEPRRQRAVFVKGVEPSIGLKERVLNDILTSITGPVMREE
jgi:hypothetical protein